MISKTYYECDKKCWVFGYYWKKFEENQPKQNKNGEAVHKWKIIRVVLSTLIFTSHTPLFILNFGSDDLNKINGQNLTTVCKRKKKDYPIINSLLKQKLLSTKMTEMPFLISYHMIYTNHKRTFVHNRILLSLELESQSLSVMWPFNQIGEG